MRNLLPPGRSLRFYSAVSWFVPGILALITCVMVSLGAAFIEYRGESNRVRQDLLSKSMTAARRLSAELLIGQRGSVDAASRILVQELHLASVSVTTQRPPCLPSSGSDNCVVQSAGTLTAFQRIPFVNEGYFSMTSTTAPQIWDFFHFSLLFWSAIPVGLLLGFGLLFQRIILRRYFLKPVQALVETSIGDQDTKAFWPEEIREISERLYRSFESRDQAVFSQIARGVIHDLRTLIHTPLGAVDLVEEQPHGTEKRLPRLEHLLSVSKQQLPKMKEIIDTALDGSRPIGITPTRVSIRGTIEGALQTLSPLCEQNRTDLDFSGNIEDDGFVHDPLQMERAITNLIKNGIEACQENSEGNERKAVHVSLRREKGFVEIDIEDSGPGLAIAPGKLFRPLKSTKTHGSGLGLVVSRKIVEAHGGEIIPGHSVTLGGAKFIIRFPASNREMSC